MKSFKLSILSILCLAAVSCGVNLEKGLVIHSDFEGNAKDLSPNHFDGALRSGATISGDCAVGDSSVYFNGDRAYVEYPERKVYFDGDYSISIWVKWEECHLWDRILDFNQVMPMSGNAVTWLIGRSDEDTENALWFDQWIFHEDIPVESILDQRKFPADAYLGYDVKLGQWDHYVVVYDSSARNPLGVQQNTKGENVPYKGKVTLYVNGKKTGESVHCLKPQPITTVANWLGRSRFSADPHFKGWMDDFRIYDRKLSAKEVTALYDLGNI